MEGGQENDEIPEEIQCWYDMHHNKEKLKYLVLLDILAHFDKSKQINQLFGMD